MLLAELKSASEFFTSTERDTFFALNPRMSDVERSSALAALKVGVSRGPSDLSDHLFLMTSGTSRANGGRWVALSRLALLASALEVNAWIQSDAKDVWLHNLPDFHIGGFSIWARAHLSGARVIKQEGWSPQDFVQAILKSSATITSLVPTQIFDLVQTGLVAPGTLRVVFVGGGGISPELYNKARKLGWPLLPTYGMTELCSQIATAALETAIDGSRDPSRKSIGNVSKAESHADSSQVLPPLLVLPHVQVQVGPDQRLTFSGPSLLSGFIEVGSNARFVPMPEAGFVSEDLGAITRAGLVGGLVRQLTLIGRAGNFIKIGGESVEVGRLTQIAEGVRLELGLSADLTVIAIEDVRLGHVIHLVSDEALTSQASEQVQAVYNARVLPLEKIRAWHRFPNLPRTSLGKLRLQDCRMMVQRSITLQGES